MSMIWSSLLSFGLVVHGFHKGLASVRRKMLLNCVLHHNDVANLDFSLLGDPRVQGVCGQVQRKRPSLEALIHTSKDGTTAQMNYWGITTKKQSQNSNQQAQHTHLAAIAPPPQDEQKRVLPLAAQS